MKAFKLLSWPSHTAAITEHAAEQFIDHRADDYERESPGLGAYVYAIDQAVAEEGGEPYLRVLVAAYAAGRITPMYENGLTPVAAACRLLDAIKRDTGVAL